ncbi:hypothetical protein DFJ58DRAFT_497210 [Suillus subalutaceus]|uniref:uncharacterized protein n=1 Tax=Suillus subalutaceus TaxID=48586 RepID=UPI001B85E1A0|nr:uncharacterized protein DFJ58DRAFT_497210 [Suillus subalutaceus]KAG1871377.1 hypothetical protein DFJ58DRAFT_497210 [Suillus subalutaceus]
MGAYTSVIRACHVPASGRSFSTMDLIGGDLSMLGISICRSDMAITGNMVRLLRPLVDDDWVTFRKYARKVRSLTFKKHDVRHCGLRDNVALALLDSHASPSPSFPLLHELYWYDMRDALLPCLHHYISASLTRLVIHSEHWPLAMVDLLAGVGKACPKIKEFRCSTPPASACTMLSDIVTYWDDLEILETVAVNAQALKHLASLKQLRELKMLVPEGYSLEPTSPFSVIFSVDKISMTAPKVEHLLAFLAPLQLSAKSAQLNIKTAPNAVDLGQLLSSITEHFKFNVLESLNVGVARPTDFADHALFEPTASALRGLRAFTGLTNLNLSSMHISITDDEIIDLVSAWPQMKHLYLDTDRSWEVTRLGVTFLGLAGVLERCPKLRSLGINLDTTALSHTHHQYTGITSEQLTDLHVGYAECNDVEAIGNLLAGVCPNLSHIYCTRPVNPDYEDVSTHHTWFEGAGTWKKVENFIIQRRREQLIRQWIYTGRF